MGERGPARTPTSLALIQGAKRAKGRARTEPQPPPSEGPPRVPAWLTPEGRKVWRQYARDLHGARLLTAWDVDTFGILCENIALLQRVYRELAKDTLLTKGDRGDTKNKLLQVVRDVSTTVKVYAQQFGLTPAARAGLDLHGGAPGKGARPSVMQPVRVHGPAPG